MVTKLWFLSFISIVTAVINLPTINLDSLGGQLGFIGDYAGLSPYKQPLQFESLSGNALVMSNLDDNIFTLFATLNGTISTYCKLSDTQYILAGDFTTINETNYNHIVQLNIQTRQLSPLKQGLDGPVRSIYCSASSVYVGGNFIAPIASTGNYTGHVALWQNDQWNSVPWKGFNGPVYSIIGQQQQQSILFAGQFDSTGDGQFFNQNSSQTINLASSATISGGNSALDGNNTNPSGVICSQSPWLLQDGVPGYWQAQFTSPIQPSIFRLSNAHIDGKGTNEFNIIALGTNQYFQLSYKDPVTNQIITCTNKCVLSNDSTILYQDFTVNNPTSVSGIRINIDTWFGTGGGLGNVEIFRSDVSLQPEITNSAGSLSTSPCSTSPSSSATTTGNWTQVFSYSTYQNYLIAKFPATQLTTTDVSVNYQPYISSEGNYNVYITTPGCVGTSTCDQRTQVSLNITMMPGNSTTYNLDQGNSVDQRTLIYSGSIAASTSAFQPSIIMHVSSNATTPSSGTVSIVADSIEFVRNSTGATLSSILNYYPSNNTWLPLPQQLPAASTVYTLQSTNNQIYIGGTFTSNSTYSNVVAFDFAKGFQPLNSGGLNGNVTSSLLVGSQLVFGGLFNNTQTPQQSQALNNVAIYDLQVNTWSGMNSGVNDKVESLYTTDNINIHLSGPFTAVNGLHQPTFNNAQWSLANSIWVPASSLIIGSVTNQLVMNNNSTLYLGSIKSAQTYRANTIASLSSNGQWQSTITDVDPNAAVNSGVFYKGNIILGGLFTLNNVKYHVAIYNGTAWNGILKNIQGDVNTLYVIQNQLLIGGQFTGTLDVTNTSVTSFAVYDLENNDFQDVQGIFNANQRPGQVNVIQAQPNGQSIYVGGNFSYAGLLNCNSICALASDSHQWSQINQGIQGSIKDMSINSDGGAITVVGDLIVGSTKTGLAVLDNINTASWRSVTASTNNQINSLLNDGTGQFIVSGTSNNNQLYLASWNGQSLSPIDTKLGSSSDVQQLMYVSVSSSPSNARYPANSDMLMMAVGHLDLPNFGSSSAALYDGTTWYPYVLTSSANGSSGLVRSTFTVTACCTLDTVHHYLSVPAVILVSVAISLGIIFALIALSFIFLFCKRRNNVKYYSDPMKEWKPKYRPTSLLTMLDAANLHDSAILATGAGVGAVGAAASSKQEIPTSGYSTALDGGAQQRGQSSMDISDSSHRLRNSSGFSTGGMVPFSVLLANALESEDNTAVASDETPKVFYAKYPFEAKEFGELAFGAHAPIVVTDTSDNVWWMGYKDDGSNHPVSGLFPSNYVTKAKPF